MFRLFALVFSFVLLSSANISYGSFFPEPEQKAGLADSFESAMIDKSLNLDLQNECINRGSRLWSEYRRDGFTNVSLVREWCNSLIVQFNINIDLFDEHCGWDRVGSYGRYSYNGQFLYFVDYPGSPQFFFEPYCSSGGSGGSY